MMRAQLAKRPSVSRLIRWTEVISTSPGLGGVGAEAEKD